MSGGPPLRDSANAPAPKRTFRSPSGRDWTVEVYALPAGIAVRSANGLQSATKAVLRFQSSDVTLDLRTVPEHWDSLTDEELVALLRTASPPTFVRS